MLKMASFVTNDPLGIDRSRLYEAKPAPETGICRSPLSSDIVKVVTLFFIRVYPYNPCPKPNPYAASRPAARVPSVARPVGPPRAWYNRAGER